MARKRVLCTAGIVVIGALLAVAATAVVSAGMSRSGPTNAVSAIMAGLQRDPRHWLNRTIRLQGTVGTTVCNTLDPTITNCFYLMTDRSTSSVLSDQLILEPGPPNAFLATLRHVPGVSLMLPARQAPDSCRSGCTVRLQYAEGDAGLYCQRLPCYEAILSSP